MQPTHTFHADNADASQTTLTPPRSENRLESHLRAVNAVTPRRMPRRAAIDAAAKADPLPPTPLTPARYEATHASSSASHARVNIDHARDPPSRQVTNVKQSHQNRHGRGITGSSE